MLKFFLKKKSVFICYILLVPAMAFTSVFFAMSLQPLFNSLYNTDTEDFIQITSIAIGLAFLDMVVTGLHKTIREKLRANFLAGIRQELVTGIFNMDTSNFCANNSAYYINILSRDVNSLNTGYFDSMCGIYRVSVCFFVTVIFLAMLNPYITVLNLFMAFISVFVPRLMKRMLNAAQMYASKASEKYMQEITDVLYGFSTIRLFRITEYIQQKLEKSNFTSLQSECRSATMNYWTAWFSMLCSTLSYVLTISIGVWLALHGKMTAGAVLSISQLIGGILAPFEELPIFLTQLSSVKELRTKLLDIMQIKKSNENQQSINIEKCDINLQHLFFSYDGQKNQISDLNYCFEAGKKYAVIGESGSGKSTLAKLIMRFYQATSGTILVNQISAEKFPEDQWYSLFGLIEQNTFLFQDTLKNNLTLYKEYSEKELARVIEVSGLTELVRRLGLNTQLTENGNNFSGGERQRIAIARALLAGADYLIFDEATSGMDAVLEHSLEQTMANLENIGIIVITHRLNVAFLKRCDGIIALKNGTIKESGTFDELMKQKGYFYNFYMVNK